MLYVPVPFVRLGKREHCRDPFLQVSSWEKICKPRQHLFEILHLQTQFWHRCSLLNQVGTAHKEQTLVVQYFNYSLPIHWVYSFFFLCFIGCFCLDSGTFLVFLKTKTTTTTTTTTTTRTKQNKTKQNKSLLAELVRSRCHLKCMRTETIKA